MIFFILLGFCVGSFLNVALFRKLNKESIISPRSHCVKCKRKLKFYHLIPVLSFVFLRGRCAFCKEKISLIYPFNECLCALIFAFSFVYIDEFLSALIFALMLSIFLLLAWMDYYLKAVEELWLWLLFFLAFCFDFLINIDFFVLSKLEENFFVRVFLAAGAVFFIKSFINFVKNYKNKDKILESLGDGDVIIIALIFGIFDYKDGFVILFLASVLSLMAFIEIAKQNHALPFVPFLWVAIFLDLCMKVWYEASL